MDALIARADEIKRNLLAVGERVGVPCPDGVKGCLVYHYRIETDPVCRDAIEVIAALQAQLATARIEGVRAGIEASVNAVHHSAYAVGRIRQLDAEVIATRSAALSDLIAGDADMIDGVMMENNDGRPGALPMNEAVPSSPTVGIADAKPVRVKLSRARGWRMPPNTVKVDRTTRWGNPYKEGITPGNYASWFRADVLREMASERPTEDHPWSRHLHAIAHNLRVLRGLNLACWCPLDAPCHADVLLELANAQGIAAPSGVETTGSTVGKSPSRQGAPENDYTRHTDGKCGHPSCELYGRCMTGNCQGAPNTSGDSQ